MEAVETVRNRRIALVASSLAAFLTPFMGSSLNLAMPSIAREFSLSAVSLGWVATSYLLAAAMCLVPFGRLADIKGRRKIFAAGIGLFCVASLLCALSRSAMGLVVSRGIQGVGGSMIFGTSVAILTSIYPAGERGHALGINTAAVYTGLSLGPVFGGILTQQWGWRSIFLANVFLGLIPLTLIIRGLKGEWAEARGESFDKTGSVLLGAGFAALMYGLSRLPSALGTGLTAAALILLALFAKWEMKTPSPLLDARLFKENRVFAFSNLAALINYSATAAVGFLLSLYLQYVKGLSPRQAGLVLIAQPIVMAFFSPATGKLSDRIEPRILASAGMAASSAGLFLLVFLKASSPFAFIVTSLVFLGFGFGLFSSPNTNAVMGSVEKRYYGVASASLGTMRLTGQMLSLGITMMIFAVVMGPVKIAPESYPLFLKSAKIAFIIFALLCGAGVFASYARGNRNGPGPERRPSSSSDSPLK